MNFIQTFFYDKSAVPTECQFGWRAPEFHLMGWALSSLLLNKTYGNVYLYCNYEAANLLVDNLRLPYDRIHSESHDKLLLPDDNLWAIPKIITYGLQKEPFVHFDGDVFIFNKLPESLVTGRLIAQNIEEVFGRYLVAKKQIDRYFANIPYFIKNDFDEDGSLRMLNVGIMGGADVEFIHKYSNLSLRFINDNVENLNKIDRNAFNVLSEQYLLYSYAKKMNIRLSLLLNEVKENNDYSGLGDFHESPSKKNYLHLLGNYKKDEFTCMQMASRLRGMYPEYFYRVLSLFKKSSSEYTAGLYADREFDSVHQYLTFCKKAKLLYSLWSNNGVEKENRKLVTDNFMQFRELSIVGRSIQMVGYPVFSDSEEVVRADFDSFIKDFEIALKELFGIYSAEYLYGRDLNAEDWFQFLFSCEDEMWEKLVIACPDIYVLKSSCNWAALINQIKLNYVCYYQNLEYDTEGCFSVIVPELCGNKFSIYYLDEMEMIILEKLSDDPLTINELVYAMKEYVEEDVLKEQFGRYMELVIMFLKQLVLRKIVRPVN